MYYMDGVVREVNVRVLGKGLELLSADGGRFLLLLLKNVGTARLRESGIHPISPKTPAPQYQPIDRKKRKGKRVEAMVGIEQLRPIKKHWPCS